MLNRTLRGVFLLGVIIFAAALVPRVGGVGTSAEPATAASPREIHLVVKDMTYFVEGQDSPNPTLHASPGERIRLVLKNTDSGMSHDFTIQGWKVHTRVLKGKGEDAVQFTVPDARGSHVYNCTPHSKMMTGTIVVQ